MSWFRLLWCEQGRVHPAHISIPKRSAETPPFLQIQNMKRLTQQQLPVPRAARCSAKVGEGGGNAMHFAFDETRDSKGALEIAHAIAEEGASVPSENTAISFDPAGINVYADDWRVRAEGEAA